MLPSTKAELLTDDARSIVTFEENNMKYKAENIDSRRVIRFSIDSKKTPSNKKRCDNAVIIVDKHPPTPTPTPTPKPTKIYFVELKGSDTKKAAEQISASIDNMRSEIDSHTMCVFARIVCSRVPAPDVNCTQVISLKRKLLKYKGDLVRKQNTLTEKI